jgi:gamma-F420-2:alpha-L-glutamate ligase
MRLVVVYGLNTGDYQFFNRFYPARRLKEECKNRSISLRFLFPADVASFIQEYSGPEDRTENLFLLRGKVPKEVSELVEKSGFRTVNPSKSLELAGDKLATASFLEKNNWPTPRTALAGTSAFADSDYPLVAKPRSGSRGKDVHLVHSRQEENALPADTLVQEYIASSHGRDLRFFFAGAEVLAVAERTACEGELVSNTCTGGRMRCSLFSPSLLEKWTLLVLSVSRESGLWYGTVDFLFLDEPAPAERTPELTICELNGSPGFEALETECLRNIAGPLVEKLASNFG